MTNKAPAPFGPAARLDLASYKPRPGKTFWLSPTGLNFVLDSDGEAGMICVKDEGRYFPLNDTSN